MRTERDKLIDLLRDVSGTLQSSDPMKERIISTLIEVEKFNALSKSSNFIEGTVVFMRSSSLRKGDTKCCCCPDGDHIFSRRVVWDAWNTRYPEHFGNGADVFVGSKITDFNENEGLRVRLTVEVVDGDTSSVAKAA